MTSTTQGQWEKVLWREQPYPDNHVDSKFLESLVVNASVAKRSYWKVVEGALLVAEQLCLVSLLSGVAFSLHEGKTSSRHVLMGQSLAFFVGLLVHCVARYAQLAYRLIHKTPPFGSKGKNLMKYPSGVQEAISLVIFWLIVIARTSVLVGLTVLLAPVYATLTASISPDTTVACIFGLLMLHLYLHDYRKSNNPEIKPTFLGSLGLACGMCASVLMSTRMQTLLDVISIMLLSLQIYILAPYFQYDVSKVTKMGHIPSCITICGATIKYISSQSIVVTSWLICALLLIVFLCPMWLVRIEKFKANINGPWDEAVPKLTDFRD